VIRFGQTQNLALTKTFNFPDCVKISASYVQPFWSYSQKSENLDSSASKTTESKQPRFYVAFLTLPYPCLFIYLCPSLGISRIS